MDDLKFGLGFTTLICAVGWLIGGVNALIACAAFCIIPWIMEIKNRRENPKIEILKCDLCGCKFKIRNKLMEYEYRILGNICPMCISRIFRYSKLEADEEIDEKPAN